MELTCKNHGQSEFALRKDGRYRCRKCAVDAVQRRRDKIKIMAVEYKGGKCQKCGYDKYIGALEFHHNDGNKEFGIASRGYTHSWNKVKEELNKCILLCSNCHKEEHAGVEHISHSHGNLLLTFDMLNCSWLYNGII